MTTINTIASGSTGNCYLISDQDQTLMLECGIRLPAIRKGIKKATGGLLTDIIGCLISHEHGDHAKSLKYLLKASVDCYMTSGTAEALKTSSHRLRAVLPLQRFQVGNWTVLAFPTRHDAKDPVGFLILTPSGDRVLYASDTYLIEPKFASMTHIMIECNYCRDILDRNVESGLYPSVVRNRVLKSHFELENVKTWLLANDLSQVKEILLIHLSGANSDASRMISEIQEVTGKPVYAA